MRPPAVPVVGQANQDTRLTLRVLDDASVDLNARYRPGDGRAMGRIRGNRVAIGLGCKHNRGSVAIALLAGVVARLAVVLDGRLVCAAAFGVASGPNATRCACTNIGGTTNRVGYRAARPGKRFW